MKKEMDVNVNIDVAINFKIENSKGQMETMSIESLLEKIEKKLRNELTNTECR